MSKFLIVGLGNIGNEYAQSRHNIGFDIADRLVEKFEGKFKIDRLADIAEIKVKGRQLIVIKPTTYMNLSGKAVKYWREKENIPTEHILVIVDDLALPLERLRVRGGGSDGGHNGLRSIQELLGTSEFPKLRFGIGNNFPKGRQADYVLSPWKQDEWPVVMFKIDKSVELIEHFVLAGLETVMNQYNNMVFKL